jgi:hypothetical protein
LLDRRFDSSNDNDIDDDNYDKSKSSNRGTRSIEVAEAVDYEEFESFLEKVDWKTKENDSDKASEPLEK